MSKKPKLLVVSPVFPYPLIAGGRLRIYHLLKQLSVYFDITLLTLIEKQQNTNDNIYALNFIDKIIVIPITQQKYAQLFRLVKYCVSWLRGTPAEVIVKHSSALNKKLKALVLEEDFDYIQFEYSQCMQYLESVSSANIPKFLVAHDISYISQERKAEVAQGLLKWFWSREAKVMKKYELKFWPKFDSVFTMSETDKAHILTFNTDIKVFIIPNGVDTENLRPIDESTEPSLIFVGWMRHLPNRDAIEWFMKEIWPLIKQKNTRVRLKIVGKGLPATLQQMAKNDSQVDYLGYVKDIAEHVGKSSLSIVPIRIGSGSRLKILESMALGTPVVTTSIGCEGINATHALNSVFADNPNDFSGAIIDLLKDKEKRIILSKKARELVEEQYSWKTIADTAISIMIRKAHDNISQ